MDGAQYMYEDALKGRRPAWWNYELPELAASRMAMPGGTPCHALQAFLMLHAAYVKPSVWPHAHSLYES